MKNNIMSPKTAVILSVINLIRANVNGTPTGIAITTFGAMVVIFCVNMSSYKLNKK